jgi:lipoprotein-anchoring transpeptidase ErfK/SrfK
MVIFILVLTSGLSVLAAEKDGFEYSSGNSYYAIVREGVNMRDKNENIIKYLDKGTEVYVYGKSKDDSSRVVIEWNNKTGTVIKNGLKKVSSSGNKTSSSTKLAYSGSSYYGEVKKYLIVRDSNYDDIGEINKGDVVKVLGTSKTWPERVVIEWNNKKGTVLKSGLKKVSSGKTSTSLTYSGKAYYAVIRYDLNMRNSKNDLMCEIPRYALVYVKGTYSRDKSRLVVTYNGKEGTVHKDGVKQIKDAVFVNISAQRVTLIKGGKLIAESKCVTGTKGTEDTPKGSFKITQKKQNKVFPSGKESDFWLRFCGGCGFHDALWRGNWSSSAYKRSGSNGCVNLPYKFAKTLYANAYVGMSVYIW